MPNVVEIVAVKQCVAMRMFCVVMFSGNTDQMLDIAFISVRMKMNKLEVKCEFKLYE